MKRIISLLLLLATVAMLFASCSRASKDIDKIKECYDRSYPHKIVVTSTQQFGAQSLLSTTEMVRGTIGSDFVAKQKTTREQLRSIEAGSGIDVYGPIETIKEEVWFRVGLGTTTDKGANWDEAGENFFPDKGVIALNLDTDLMDDVVYEDDKMTFKVAKANTKAFFGQNTSITEDVSVVIYTGGGFVTGVEVTWVKPENYATGVEMTTVNIKAEYIYDQQNVTFD